MLLSISQNMFLKLKETEKAKLEKYLTTDIKQNLSDIFFTYFYT